MLCEQEKRVTKPRILVVDDEEHLRDTLKRWFEIRGFEVDVAENGEEAVRKCDQSDYDIVTMDLEMPRMKGQEAIAAIRTRRPNLPILALTGYYSEGDSALRCGADKVLAKPVSLQKLEEEVRQMIGAPRG